jgi:hypothetical protein
MTDSTTSAAAAPAPADTTKLTAYLKGGPKQPLPVGFFVASDVWTALAAHPEVKQASSMPFLRTPSTGGIPIACDPDLPAGQVDVALSLAGFQSRLNAIKAKGPSK